MAAQAGLTGVVLFTRQYALIVIKIGTFPTTTGSWSPGNPAQTGAMCNEAAVKIAFELSGVISSIRTSINGVLRDSTGCIPLTVDFADTIALGKKYVWDFGDGSQTNNYSSQCKPYIYKYW